MNKKVSKNDKTTVVSKIDSDLTIRIIDESKFNDTYNNYLILGIKGNKRDLGISAQDVEKILPDLVNIAPVDVEYDEEKNIISKTGSNYLTVNYEKMIPLLIESIKELNKNINELKKENIELRDLIKSQ